MSESSAKQAKQKNVPALCAPGFLNEIVLGVFKSIGAMKFLLTHMGKHYCFDTPKFKIVSKTQFVGKWPNWKLILVRVSTVDFQNRHEGAISKI